MAHNIREIAMSAMWLSLVLALLIGVIVSVLTRFFIHDRHRAAMAAMAVLFFFFTYGQIYHLFVNVDGRGARLLQHASLLVLYGALLILALYWIVRKAEHPGTWTYPLNVLALCLLVYPTFVITSTVIAQNVTRPSSLPPVTGETKVASSAQPDIYYIILDAYGRNDVLKDHLWFDNAEFVAALRERGFYVADCSQSNYAHTEYSLTSSLNYDYLDRLNVNNRTERVVALKMSAVRSFLKGRGYRIVASSASYKMTDWKDADLYLDFERTYSPIPEFEKLVMDTTVLRMISDFDLFGTNRFSNSDRRARILSLLKNLKRLPAEEGDLFVFAHFAIPHPPYQFGPNGEWREEPTRAKDFRDAYIGQVIFINREILEVIDALLSTSETPPVIIVQGDHGPPVKLAPTADRRMPILNAYYLPGVDTDKVLYSSISPVNSFRVVLNSYFGQNLPLLEDISYYAPDKNRDALEVVPYSCPNQK